MKYKLTKNTKEVNGFTLFQIQALKDFGDVKKGDLGGWIEKENNLCQEDNSWIFGDAKVYGDAIVYGNAKVYGDAIVYGNALVSGNAWVYGNAEVYGNAKVYGDAIVYGNAKVYGDAIVYGNAKVYGDIEEPKEEIKSEYICEDDFQRIISGDVNEVIIDGVKYKKVVQSITSWRKIF
jgi:carbonic anhydrase/acetyltransferase-like protein (isoleucine patch superfamily)